jgi:hypothetical protein
MNIIKSRIAIAFLLVFSSFYAQETVNKNYEELIIDTWVVQGQSSSERLVFKSNGELEEYTDNKIEDVYSWVIEDYGIKGLYLAIENIKDPTDYWNYEISALNDELLVLIYIRPNHMGIAKPATYVRYNPKYPNDRMSGTWTWYSEDGKHMVELVLKIKDQLTYSGFYCSVYNDGKKVDCPNDEAKSYMTLRKVNETTFSGSFSSSAFGGKGDITLTYLANKNLLQISISEGTGEYYLPNNVLFHRY